MVLGLILGPAGRSRTDGAGRSSSASRSPWSWLNFAYIYPVLTDELLPYKRLAGPHVAALLDLTRRRDARRAEEIPPQNSPGAVANRGSHRNSRPLGRRPRDQ